MNTEASLPNPVKALSPPEEPSPSHPGTASIDQNLQQSGKFGVNVGQGQGIHIGDVYQQIDSETIKQIVREELRLPQREYGDSVGLGLTALAELMHHPGVRSDVIAFRVDFQAACEWINVIADYKELHDLLHTLEFQCYSGIIQESKRLCSNLEDETALEILIDHELTLQRILREAKEVAGREIIASNELQWLKNLEQAQEELHSAIEESDTRRLQHTIWLLNRILAIQPSRINTNLNTAAKALRLPALVNAMNAIWERLMGTDLNQEKIQQFQKGVAGLAELNQRLTALVCGHDYWQELDLELRRIEKNLDKDWFELEMSWPDLKERTEGLFDPAADQWTIAFQRDSYNLNTALNARHPKKIQRYFRMYRRRASERFFQVDATLKRLCDELREVGEPLASVLRIIE